MKQTLSTVSKPKLQKLKEFSKNRYLALKASLAAILLKFKSKNPEKLEEYNEYLEESEENKEKYSAMDLKNIEGYLDDYNNIENDNLSPQMPIMADALNDVQRDKTGDDNKEFLEKQPKVLDFILLNRDKLLADGTFSEGYFDIIDLLKMKVNLLKCDYNRQEKMALCSEIYMTIVEIRQLSSAKTM